MEVVLQILFVLFVGWPAIIACVLAILVGLFRKDHRLLTLSGIIAIPFSWMLSGFPRIGNLMFLAPMLLFLSAWTMFHKWEMAAWLLAIPFLMLILLLLAVVIQ